MDGIHTYLPIEIEHQSLRSILYNDWLFILWTWSWRVVTAATAAPRWIIPHNAPFRYTAGNGWLTLRDILRLESGLNWRVGRSDSRRISTVWSGLSRPWWVVCVIDSMTGRAGNISRSVSDCLYSGRCGIYTALRGNRRRALRRCVAVRTGYSRFWYMPCYFRSNLLDIFFARDIGYCTERLIGNRKFWSSRVSPSILQEKIADQRRFKYPNLMHS